MLFCNVDQLLSPPVVEPVPLHALHSSIGNSTREHFSIPEARGGSPTPLDVLLHVSHTPEPPGQEPGSDAEILKFTKEKYAVTFPVFSKLLVNGPQASDLYKWLKAETPKDSSSSSADIRWNFTKVRSPDDVPRRLRVA